MFSHDGIGWRWQILAFLAVFAALITRRPDAIFAPQFYAEDGNIWFAQAYNFGWLHALFIPHTGYFQTLPRLAAALALLVPLLHAPLIMNLTGLAVQTLPVNFLLASRSAPLAPLLFRMLMAFTYIALPDVTELHATVTNGQWHLALVACLILVAKSPTNNGLRALDFFLLALAGLTGPFAVMLFPVAFMAWLLDESGTQPKNLAIISVSALIQLTTLALTAQAARKAAPLGASLRSLFQLLGGQIYLGALYGHNQLALGIRFDYLLCAVAAVAGTALIVYCARRAPWAMRLLLIFCGMVAVSSLTFPLVSFLGQQWEVLKYQSDTRYWFFPGLALVWSAVWCTQKEMPAPLRLFAVALLLVLPFGISRGWRHIPYSDEHFPAAAASFETAPPGTWGRIPSYPGAWQAQLIKKSPTCGTVPAGALDPIPPLPDTSTLEIRGYVSAPKPVDQVFISVDHVLKTSLKPNEPRPDIDAYFPLFPDRNKGFRTALNLTGLPPGRHEIEVRASVAGGCAADISAMPFSK